MLLTISYFFTLFFSGFVLVSLLAPKISLIQKTALGFPFGFAFYSILMLAFNLINVKFSIVNLSVTAFVFAALGVLLKYKYFVNLFKYKKGSLNDFIKIRNINFTWIFLFGILAYLLYGIISKSLFWPPTAYDSFTGYDYMAKVLANEGCFNNSIFDVVNPTNSIRHSYPPFVCSTFSIAYMIGLNSSKVTLILLLISFLFLFYSLTFQRSNHTLTILFTLLLFATPEFLAMSALSLTNVPQTIFASAGLIFIAKFINDKQRDHLLLGAILVGLNVWSRYDGLVFIGGGAVMLFMNIIAQKKYKKLKNYISLFLFILVSISPLIAWQSFQAIKIDGVFNSSDAFVSHLFFDPEKISFLIETIWAILKSTQYYGWTFIAFVIVLILNVRNIRNNNLYLLTGIIASFLLYSFLYYQMDNDSGNFNYSLQSMVSSSFKRGMFPFLPLLCYYMATSTILNKVAYFILEKNPTK
ncbi:MAG: glycosyltransferase family 39 protein [Prolixibacteraceae bacterium]|jgi:hypothetical protein|nr:glycosyltransferase family 39 protein [Prolixibacteraceae bacterium]